MRELRTANIELVEDPNFKFKYSKKVSKKVTQFIKVQQCQFRSYMKRVIITRWARMWVRKVSFLTWRSSKGLTLHGCWGST